MIDILIIDDEPDIKAPHFLRLPDDIYNVVIALNIREAKIQLENHSFDEILLDYSLEYKVTGMDIIPLIQPTSLKEKGVVIPNSFNGRYSWELMQELEKQKIPRRGWSLYEEESF